MDDFLKLFSSNLAVAIAWLCTVLSFIYAFVQKSNSIKIEKEFNLLNITCEELKTQNFSLKQKIIDIETNDIHDNYQEVNQNGTTNINQGVIKGDVHFTQ